MIFDNYDGGNQQSNMWQFIGRLGYVLLIILGAGLFSWGLQRLFILLGVD